MSRLLMERVCFSSLLFSCVYSRCLTITHIFVLGNILSLMKFDYTDKLRNLNQCSKMAHKHTIVE